MPIPRRVGQWNKVGLNRLTRHIAPWMPGFGVIVHRGRRSGRRYQTPVNVFPTAGNAALVAAKDQGFFEKRGLDVEILFTATSGAQRDGLVIVPLPLGEVVGGRLVDAVELAAGERDAHRGAGE